MYALPVQHCLQGPAAASQSAVLIHLCLGLALSLISVPGPCLPACLRGQCDAPLLLRRFVKQLPPLPYLLSPPHFFPPLRRCNVSDLLSGLETLSGILIDNDLSLEALPALSLWEYVARTVARYGTVDF